MEVGRPQRTLFCPRCGAANPAKATTCRHCGQDLRLVAAAVSRRRLAMPRPRRALVVVVALLVLVLATGLVAWRVAQMRQAARHEAQITHYLNGVWAAEVGRWDLAAAEFAAAGDYRDAEERRAEAERRLSQVEERYRGALDALDRGKTWQAAFALFQVTQALPNYRDATTVLAQARAELGPLLLFGGMGPDDTRVILSTPEGGEQQPLNDQPGLATDAEFSADGRHLLFEIIHDERSDLWLQQLDAEATAVPGGRQLLVAQAKDVWGRFSPDGQWVLFAWWGHSGWNLATVPASGGEPTRLISNADFVAGAFGPNSDRISFWVREDTYWRLGLTTPTSNRVQELEPAADQFGILEFSPDGRIILYGYARDGRYHLKLQPVAGSEAIEPAAGAEFAWARVSPDGERLLLWVWQEHLGRLLLTDLQGRRQRELVNGAADAWGEFSPDGRQIVYGVWNGRTWRIILADADGSGEMVLAEAVDDAQASFAPKGRWLLYSLWSAGGWELVLRDLNDASERVLVGEARFASAQFQPDNEHLLVWYIPTGQDAATLAVAEAVSGRRIALAQNLTAAAGAFARNGQTFAVALQPATGATASVFVANADGTGLLEFAPNSYRVYWARAPFAFGSRLPRPPSN